MDPAGPSTLDVGGMGVAYDERPGGTPIVMLHGLTATRRYVVHGSTLLPREGYRTLAYDARGHGDTDPAPDGTYDYARLADDAAGVMDAAGIDRAVLMGVSMGSATALALALGRPERVAGLVIVTPAHRGAPSSNLAHWDALADGLESGGVDGFLEAYGPPAAPERVRASIVTVMRQRMERHRHPAAVAAALRGVPRSAAFAGVDALRAIAVPTLIVASRDTMDAEHPLEVSREYERVIPGARLVVEDEGESPLAWRGGSLSRVVGAFLADADLGPGASATVVR